MRHRSRSVAAGALALAIVTVTAAPAAAGDPPEPGAPAAVSWLVDQQEADGGFELADFPGFETSDAIAALAAAGQADDSWSTTEALASVEAVQTGGGLSPLDAIDDFVDAGVTPAQAAKLISLVVAPLGLDATDVDPSGDSAVDIDLVATMAAAAGDDGDYPDLAFNARLYAALALALTGAPEPAALLDAIEAAQQANGGWNYSGDPAGTEVDADTTGLALQALGAWGVGNDAGVRMLARTQRPSGAWQAFGADDPNATAVAMLGIASQGGDPGDSCWRDAAIVAFAGTDYVPPASWLVSQQQADGRIASPNDGWGVNTFATAQSIQGLLHRWPPAERPATACPSLTPVHRFVHRAYADLLGRLADPSGTTNLTGRIEGGASRSVVPATLLGSTEGRRRAVDRWFRALVDRPADAGALGAFAPVLAAGNRNAVLAAILGSVEYRAKNGGTDAGFLDALYLDVLGRPADVGGKQAFLEQLSAGRTRAQVARALVSSTEGRGRAVRDLYQHLLHRPADPAAVAFWRERFAPGGGTDPVAIALVASAEYLGLAQG